MVKKHPGLRLFLGKCRILLEKAADILVGYPFIRLDRLAPLSSHMLEELLHVIRCGFDYQPQRVPHKGNLHSLGCSLYQPGIPVQLLVELPVELLRDTLSSRAEGRLLTFE